MASSPSWRSRIDLIRRSLNAAKAAALVVLLEQTAEMLFMGVSLAEHPGIVLMCLVALGFPVPRGDA